MGPGVACCPEGVSADIIWQPRKPQHLRVVALAPDRTPEAPARARGAWGRCEPGLCQRAWRGEAARARTRACFAG